MTEDKSNKLHAPEVAVMFSINKPHTENIKSGKKIVELRLRPPSADKPYKALIYETKKHGGCGKVIGEFTAENIMAYKHLSNFVPVYLMRRACVSKKELLEYTDNGQKEVTEIAIYDLKIYDKPKDLDDYFVYGKSKCNQKNCRRCWYMGPDGICDAKDVGQPLFCPPQSWCYVRENEE